MVKAQQRPESFLQRLCTDFVPKLINRAEPLDLCGIVSGMSLLDIYHRDTFNLTASRAATFVKDMDSRQISLLANAFARQSHQDKELFQSLLDQVPRILDTSSGKDVAVLLNSLAQISGHAEDGTSTVSIASFKQSSNGGMDAANDSLIAALGEKLPTLLPKMDVLSLVLTLNAFARINLEQKDCLDLLVEELLIPERLQKATAQQLAMILNASGKIRLYEPNLLSSLAGQLRLKGHRLDAHGICVVANASARLKLGVDTFQGLYEHLPRFAGTLSGQQIGMLCHAWASAHIYNDDLFALLKVPLAREFPRLTAHQVALIAYGYAHFRKGDEDVFDPLVDRFRQLLSEDQVSHLDLLMLSNALGRINRHDDAVEVALKEYAARNDSMGHLTPQAIRTFNIGSD
eukprot:gnl/MRDRNA2_/MRDRNA2_239451_c0_seq1.p1 gnl/MRDRNA2_/MRDRNA2_239451_c0~~gnl/MRDRNA2_/MRDRNA2_239451_c0_seq1.p1  ORF type:complete len:429 (+),score=84.89 gnl/MRDRNA2_/MRDRNA2_239451_c0_seq1:79-1287(+)